MSRVSRFIQSYNECRETDSPSLISKFAGIVSVHGGLGNLPNVTTAVGPKLLVLSGGEDDTATEVHNLEDTLDAANATWEITRYSDIQHAFTVWNDGRDRYDAWADMRYVIKRGAALGCCQ